METNISNIRANVIEWQVDWLGIKNLCRSTVRMNDGDTEPLREWKRKLLIAEHSPLRHSLITVQIDNIPYAISTHLVRHHEGVTSYVATSREDRTGIDRSTRSQMEPVSMRMDLNIQALINISRKRLCNQADKITQIVWLEVLKAVAEYDIDIFWACVPEGIRCCGCPERFGNCCICENIISQMDFYSRLDIEKRYDCYNNHRNRILRRD